MSTLLRDVNEICDCEDCNERDEACSFDCDADEMECGGCAEARSYRDEVEALYKIARSGR